MKTRIVFSLALLGLIVLSISSGETEARKRRVKPPPAQSQQASEDEEFSQSQSQSQTFQSSGYQNPEDYNSWDLVQVADENELDADSEDGKQQTQWKDDDIESFRPPNQRPVTSRYPSRPSDSNQNVQRTVTRQPTANPRGENTVPSTEAPSSTLYKPSTSTTPTTPEKYQDNQPEAHTKKGVFRGKIITTATGKEVYAFYGIPYAKPPVGDLRFKRPVPMDKLDTPYEAVELPNACYQNKDEVFGDFSGAKVWNPNTNVSEDCLYLNIWVPATIFNEKSNELVATMFWIFGGGFFSGSSSLEVYNGAVLASENDVVVISSQYRVGPLGFLYFGTEDAPGNVGLLDQASAIQWANENIEYFGGDPNSITLIGESAGGASVSLHSLSPITRSLFKRGIMLSGVATTNWLIASPASARDVSYGIAKHFGCTEQNSISGVGATQKTPKQIAECLRKVDLDSLVTTQWKFYTKILNFPVKPTIDGYFLTDYPSNLISNGEAKRNDIIIGTVADEGSYFALYQYLKYYDHQESTSVPYERYVDIMKEVFQDYSDLEKTLIIDHYTNWENPHDGYENQRKISDAIGHAFFTCPIRQYADVWSTRGLRVYYYHFTQRTSSNPWGKWMGVMHGDEIEYIFGAPVSDSSRFTPEEKELSIKMMKLFTNFAKTGVPSNKWERYHQETPIYVDLNATKVSDETTPDRFGPEANNCFFWNHFLPKLRRHLNSRNPKSQQVQRIITPGQSFGRNIDTNFEGYQQPPQQNKFQSVGGIHGGNGILTNEVYSFQPQYQQPQYQQYCLPVQNPPASVIPKCAQPQQIPFETNYGGPAAPSCNSCCINSNTVTYSVTDGPTVTNRVTDEPTVTLHPDYY